MDMPVEFRKHIEALGDVWTRAHARKEFADFPDGSYHLRLMDIVAHVSQKGGFSFRFEFLCLDGPKAGETWKHYRPVTENSIGFLYELLNGLGHPIEVEDRDFIEVTKDLETAIEQLIVEKPSLVGTISKDPVKTKGKDGKPGAQLVKDGEPQWFPPRLSQIRLDEGDSAEVSVDDKPLAYQVGDRVEVDFGEDGWFPGVVQKIADDGSVDVLCDDGENTTVTPVEVRPLVDGEASEADDREPLLILATIGGIDVEDDESTDSIREKVKAREWLTSEVSEGEAKYLEEIGVKVLDPEPLKKAKKKGKKGKKK